MFRNVSTLWNEVIKLTCELCERQIPSNNMPTARVLHFLMDNKLNSPVTSAAYFSKMHQLV